MNDAIKTLAALKTHPGVTLVESVKRGKIHGWNDDTKVVVNLTRGWFNFKHEVNVVIGASAAEVLGFFNGGHIREMTAEERMKFFGPHY